MGCRFRKIQGVFFHWASPKKTKSKIVLEYPDWASPGLHKKKLKYMEWASPNIAKFSEVPDWASPKIND